MQILKEKISERIHLKSLKAQKVQKQDNLIKLKIIR